jgi:hypothetical protein
MNPSLQTDLFRQGTKFINISRVWGMLAMFTTGKKVFSIGLKILFSSALPML